VVILRRLNSESLPDFCEPITDVNQVGTFGNRPIHVLSYRGDTDAVAALVRAGADVNAVGDMGSTPLHEAVDQGHLETVKFLLTQGALTNIKNEFGQTAADIARERGMAAILALFPS
jgi:ankyrin repeat protein